MQSKATEVITIRTTETKESTTKPLIIVVPDDKGCLFKSLSALLFLILSQKAGEVNGPEED